MFGPFFNNFQVIKRLAQLNSIDQLLNTFVPPFVMLMYCCKSQVQILIPNSFCSVCENIQHKHLCGVHCPNADFYGLSYFLEM